MIRPLRRRQRWIVRGLLALLIVAAALAISHPPPDRLMDSLPPVIAQERR